MLPTPSSEGAFSASQDPAKDQTSDNATVGSIDEAGDPFWSATPYDANQTFGADATPYITATNTSGLDFNEAELQSPWNLFSGSGVFAGTAPTETANPCNADSSTKLGLPSTTDQRYTNPVPDESQVSYFVNHVISNTFPFLGPEIRNTLGRKLSSTQTDDPLIRSSTLAHCLTLQTLGLERIGFGSSKQSSVTQQKNEAMQQVRSAARRIVNDRSQMDAVQNSNLWLSVLQLILMQASPHEICRSICIL
jgi:hypothetical protein